MKMTFLVKAVKKISQITFHIVILVLQGNTTLHIHPNPRNFYLHQKYLSSYQTRPTIFQLGWFLWMIIAYR